MPDLKNLDIDLHVRYIQQLDTVGHQMTSQTPTLSLN